MERHTLANGIRLIADPMPSLETVALGVWVRAGTLDETNSEHGVAHLLEHMAFKGTTNRTARQIAEEIENVGGYLNAATSHQQTGYYARVIKQDAPLALDILHDILTNPTFENVELEKEKEVVVQEIGEAFDDPDDFLFEQLSALAWGQHPLGKPILGTAETVREQTPDSLSGYMTRQYAPDQMIVAAAGAIDPAQFFNDVATKFDSRKPNDDRQERASPVYIGAAARESREIEQTHLAISFQGISTCDEHFFAVKTLSEILGGGMSSRLFQKIREDRGLAYSVYSFADCFDDVGLFGAYAGTDEAHAEEVLTLMRAEIEMLASGGVGAATAVEVDRARAMLKSSLLMSLESPAARIEGAAGQLFTRDEILGPAIIAERLDKVSAADIRHCAARVIEAGAPSVSVVGPGNLEKLTRAAHGSV